MLKQCVHVRWAIEQQAKLKSLIKMSFFHFHLSKHWVYDEPPPPSPPTDRKFISRLDSCDLSLALLFSGGLKSKI